MSAWNPLDLCRAGMRAAGRVNSRLRRWREEHRLLRIYDRFCDFTMINASDYLANLELASTIRNMPGCVVECGVWRGGMSAGIATILGPEREYFLFDSFEGLPAAKPIDGLAALNWQQATTAPSYYDNCTADESYAREAMRIAGASRAHLVKGWFENTLSNFTSPSPIALLRLDGDWYDSTMTCLDRLFPFVRPGGVVIVDDYYTWDGCARAVHDYLSKNGCRERIYSQRGVCFIRKLDVAAATAHDGCVQ